MSTTTIGLKELLGDRYDDLVKEMEDIARRKQAEICICAAVRIPDGSIIRGHRHLHALVVAWNEYPSLHITKDMQGFITSRNRFVTRAEGAELQRLAGVKSAATGREVEGDVLTSEDLY
jgi:hypothetical protein